MCLPGGEKSGWAVLVGEVEEVGCVAYGVAFGGHVSGSAGVEVVFWDFKGLLQGERVLDKGGDQTRDDVPFDVAVEKPDT